MCGTAEWEWKEDRHAYEPIETTCMGCYMKHMADEGPSAPGSSISLIKTDTIRHARHLLDQQRREMMERDDDE